MIRYKRNNYILGRIFSYDIDADGQFETYQFDPQILKNVSEEQVEVIKKELEDVKERHKESIEEFKKKQIEFKKYLESQEIILRLFKNESKPAQITNDEKAHHFKDNEGMDKLITELLEKQLLNLDHPFFKNNSPFYLSTDNKLVKEVSLPEHKNAFREPIDEKQFAVFE